MDNQLTPFENKAIRRVWQGEQWYFVLVDIIEKVPDNIHDEGLKSAYEEANVQTWTPEELEAYDYAFMREEDERAKFDQAIKKTIKKVEENKDIEAVIGLHNNDVPIHIISKSLNISEQRVLEIIKNHNEIL